MLEPVFWKFAIYGLWGNQKCYFDRNTLLNKKPYCICFVNGLCARVWMCSFSRTFMDILSMLKFCFHMILYVAGGGEAQLVYLWTRKV
jgi:hypothetical protein